MAAAVPVVAKARVAKPKVIKSLPLVTNEFDVHTYAPGEIDDKRRPLIPIDVFTQKIFIQTPLPTDTQLQTPPPRVIGFDLDGTLIVPKTGKKFPTDKNDYKWRLGMLEGLRRDHAAGYQIVIITNQLAAGKKGQINDIIDKIKMLSDEVGFELLYYISTAEDRFRKPSPIIGDIMKNKLNIYIGDAAGRPGDHADSDLKFAINCGVDFRTPEEYVKFGAFGEFPPPGPPMLNITGFDPAELIVGDNTPFVPFDKRYVNTMVASPQEIINSVTLTPETTPELIIMVGAPASGKSFIASSIAESTGYLRVSNDDYGGQRTSCINIVSTFATEGRSIIIDNTSPDIATRKAWIDLVQTTVNNDRARNIDRKDYLVTIIVMTTPLPLIAHMNFVRMALGGKYIPSIAYNIYYKKYVPPTPAEADRILFMQMIPKFGRPAFDRFYNCRW
jgi:bifunctional polynucleotide phosphatase/kinase